MFLFPKNAQQQNALECKNLAFAMWSVLLLHLQDKYLRAKHTDRLNSPCPAAQLATICNGESAVARLVGHAVNGAPIPDELTLNILIKLASDLKADLWLKCSRPNGQFRQCLFIRSRTPHAQLAELLPADSCSRLVLVTEEDNSGDVPFGTLFELAADAGYRLTVRLLYDNQPVPGAGFDRRYPQLKTMFNRYLRGRASSRLF
jgi:hypothetical protein